MEIYLIRHGIAEDRTKYDRDEQRPLTDKGRQKTKDVAQRLHHIGVKFNSILTSPLVRARQTAEILLEIGLSTQIEELPALAPDGNLDDWVNWWQKSVYNKSESYLALVGHQPNLGNWAETLVWGSSKGQLVVKKAGLIGLRLPTQSEPIGKSELFLLTSPKWILSAS